MSDPLHVPATEHGRVRVFTAELAPDSASAITANNVGKVLNADLDPAKVEVVPSGVFEELGLAGYLIEGYGVSEETLAGRKAALDALSGLVILIPTSAFKGKEQTIQPKPSIRLVGVFDEEPTRAHDMSRHSPEPVVVTPRPEHPPVPQRSRVGSTMIVLGALLIAAALVVWLFL